MENRILIEEELQRAETASSEPVVTDAIVELDADRVSSDSDVTEEEFLFKLMGTPCFPRGEVSSIAGPPKSAKTFFTTMLMACAVKKKVLALERVREEPLKVMWYDTEQSRMTTKRILTHRVGRMIGLEPDRPDEAEQTPEQDTNFPDDQFYVFNVRKRLPKERLDRLALAIETYEPDLCIVDGIADLLEDINNGPAAIELMQQLLSLAAENKCNITTVIHLNRTGEKLNLRGWIGTVMIQKSYDIFNCSQVFGTRTFQVGLTSSRRFYLDDPLYFNIDDEGLPYQVSGPDIQQRDDNGKFMANNTVGGSAFNKAYIDELATDKTMPWDFRKLFTDAFGTAAMVGYDDLESRVKKLANIRQKQYYYKLFAESERRRIVKKTLTKGGRVGVILLPPQ